MDCATVHFDGNCDYAEFSHTKYQVARKSHSCYECRRIIKKLETYEIHREKHDGRWYTQKTCEDCLSIQDYFFSDGGVYGEMLEAMSEHVRECSGRMSETAISHLTPRARAWVCKEIEKTWGNDA